MKYFITILVTAVVVGLGVFAYFKGYLPTFSFNKPQAVSTVSTAVPTPEGTTPVTPSASPSAGFTRVKAGGILVFNAYTIDVPTDWTYSKEGAPTGDIVSDKLIIKNGVYQISIYQAATGGAPCLYPGDSDVEGPSSRFTSFVEITTATGDKLRRGVAEGSTSGFTVCELQSGGYGQPTAFGHIAIASPVSPTSAMLNEIDSILASLRKI